MAWLLDEAREGFVTGTLAASRTPHKSPFDVVAKPFAQGQGLRFAEVLNIGHGDRVGNYISLHTKPEPKKPWRKQWPLLKEQNAHSMICNNAARTITGHVNGTPFPEGPNVGNNYKGEHLKLVDAAAMDFRPLAGSPLIDAGRKIPGITDGYQGEAPDVGAYEFGGERWTAGITWKP